jgi:hypothetical protein
LGKQPGRDPGNTEYYCTELNGTKYVHAWKLEHLAVGDASVRRCRNPKPVNRSSRTQPPWQFGKLGARNAAVPQPGNSCASSLEPFLFHWRLGGTGSSIYQHGSLSSRPALAIPRHRRINTSLRKKPPSVTVVGCQDARRKAQGTIVTPAIPTEVPTAVSQTADA